MPIYVIGGEAASLVKIGYANNPVRRLTELQVSNPVRLEILATLPGARAEERQLHRHFTSHRRHGEWFDFGPEDPVRAVVSAWLEVTQPVITPAIPPLAPATPADTLASVRGSFAAGEDFLSTTTLLSRIDTYGTTYTRKESSCSLDSASGGIDSGRNPPRATQTSTFRASRR